MEFSRHEYWSGLPCPPPGDLPDTGIERRTPALQGDSLPSGPPGQPTVYLPLFILIYGSSAPGILSSEPQTCVGSVCSSHCPQSRCALPWPPPPPAQAQPGTPVISVQFHPMPFLPWEATLRWAV